jgi:hypothetical protein
VFEKDKLCSSCQAGKQVRNTHPKKSMMRTSKAFELLYMELFGSTQYTSISGNKYDFVIVDDYTIYTWVLDWTSLTRNMMKDSCLDPQPLAKHIEFGIWQVVL